MTVRTLLALATLALLALPAVSAAAPDRPARGPSAEALRIARESRAAWSLGRLAVREQHGRVRRARVDLVHGGAVVGRLRVDPRTGGFLVEHEAGAAPAEPLDPSGLRAGAEQALRDLDVGGWAWPAEHGAAWRVPLLYRGRVVGTVTVDPRKGRLLPDNDEDDD